MRKKAENKARKFFRWIAPRLPRDVQSAFIDGLVEFPKHYSTYRLLQKLARNFDIAGFLTNGSYGYILGDVNDIAVFRKYALEKVWTQYSDTLFSKFLREGGTYLDIGGNIGLTTIPIAQNPNIECHVFEPNPAIFYFLNAKIASNCQRSNVMTYQIALFDREDELTLERSPENLGDSRVRLSTEAGELAEENWVTSKISAKPLDTVISDLRALLAVKIDTQGAEPFVIEGGKRLLSKANLLATEFWPYGMARMGGDPQVVIGFIRQNFSYGQISRGHSDRFSSWLPIEKICADRKSYVKNSIREADYLDVLLTKSDPDELPKF